jgi:hypothetical protein
MAAVAAVMEAAVLTGDPGTGNLLAQVGYIT